MAITIFTGMVSTHLEHVRDQHPPCSTPSSEWDGLALMFRELWPSYSLLFLGAGALVDNGAGPFGF